MPNFNINHFDINRISHEVRTSEAFGRTSNEDGTAQLTDRDRRRKAISKAALSLTRESKGGYLTLEGHAMNVTAKLTYLSDSLDELHRLQDGGARRSEKLPALRKMAEFNHAVKDMVNDNPSLTFAEVLSFILKMNQNINGRSAGGHQFETEIRGRLVGMCHEIAFEQILGKITSIDYRESTVEDDLNGADIFVSLDNSPMVAIDIKASYETAQRSKNEAAGYGFDPSRILWSHCYDEDFSGTFRLSNQAADIKSSAVYGDLRNVIFPEYNSSPRLA